MLCSVITVLSTSKSTGTASGKASVDDMISQYQWLKESIATHGAKPHKWATITARFSKEFGVETSPSNLKQRFYHYKMKYGDTSSTSFSSYASGTSKPANIIKNQDKMIEAPTIVYDPDVHGEFREFISTYEVNIFPCIYSIFHFFFFFCTP